MNEHSLRKERIDLMGRSSVLNILGIILNLTGLTLVVIGYHDSVEDGFMYKLIGFILMAATLFSMFILKGLFLYSYIARGLVGGLFIVSGLVKANDPWGFAFKLEEYFEPEGLAHDFPFFAELTPYVLHLSIIICVVEIVLGVAIIVGGKIKLASWSLVLMMAGFTWLTWYTAACVEASELALAAGEEYTRQCVTDCGCFGDALRGSVGRSLTPAESYWKDLVLFYLVFIIFINQWKIKLNTPKQNWAMVSFSMVVVIFFSWVFGWLFPIFFALFALLGSFVVANLNITKLDKAWKMAIFTTVISLVFSLYTSSYLPIKDYRPYAIGNNIQTEMDKEVPAEIEFVWIYKNLATGENEEFATSDYEIYGDKEKYEYVDRKETVITPGVEAPIKDFVASIDFESLGEKEKANAIIDSLIAANYDMYYEEKMVVTGPYGPDTISPLDYDTLYYPDSVYTAGAPFISLADPSMRFTLDLTQYLLSLDKVFLMTIRDIESVNDSHIPDFKAVYEGAEALGIPFYVISPASQDKIDAFCERNDFYPTFLAFDGTEVKILVRSNPGLLLLEKATVLDKWPCRSIPDFEDINSDYNLSE